MRIDMPDSQTQPEIPGMALIPEGWFLMGSTDAETQLDVNAPGEDYLQPSRPQRRVYLPAFYMDIYPVTYSDYKAFVDVTGYDVPRWPTGLSPPYAQVVRYDWDLNTRKFDTGLERHPVVCVTWYDAMAYCDWAGKRLPTEAEWEKAARGSDGRAYPWGWDDDLKRHCCVHINCHQISHRDPRIDMCSVDAYPLGKSPYGCYDMLGNCEEWCADWFDEDYYAVAPECSPTGPELPGQERFRTVRGCGRYWPELHVALRNVRQAWRKDCGTSFRCALSVEAACGGQVRTPIDWKRHAGAAASDSQVPRGAVVVARGGVHHAGGATHSGVDSC